jgi:SAM-dependent methyltransferase
MTKERLESFRRLGAAFAAGGERYDRLRPGYPDQAVTWLVEGTPAAGVVVDVGAGTGKLTAALLAHGFAVIAVDPSHDMLAQLSRQLPTVQTQVGTGEAAGLPDHTADLITFAQSWHSSNRPPSRPRPRAFSNRAAGPGGCGTSSTSEWRGSPSWPRSGTPWRVRKRSMRLDMRPCSARPSGRWTRSNWADTMPVVDLAELVTTRSYYLNASEQKQQQIGDQVTAFIAGAIPRRQHR